MLQQISQFIQQTYSISISMSRKQGIIHLGRSKSPSRFHRKSPSSRQNAAQSLTTSRSRQPLQETILNQSVHVSSQPIYPGCDHIQFANTHSGFFPPNPQAVQRTIIIKQNIKSPQRKTVIQQSPMKRVIVSRTLGTNAENSPLRVTTKPSNSSQVTAKENQLLMKIKVLQFRINELHTEKQKCVVEAHQQNKKLCFEIENLQRKLANLESLKNQQISGLKNQVLTLKSMIPRVEQVEKTQKPVLLKGMGKQLNESSQLANKSQTCLKNAAYTEDQDQTTSLHNHIQKSDQITSQLPTLKVSIQQQCKQLMNQVSQLEKQNELLRCELTSSKQTANLAAAIQQNHRQIVSNFQERIAGLTSQLASRITIEQYHKLKQSSQLLKGRVEQYVTMLLETQQKLNTTEQKLRQTSRALQQKKIEIQTLKQSESNKQKELSTNRQEKEQYVCMILQKQQEAMKKEDQFKSKIYDLQSLNQSYKKNFELSEQKIMQLQSGLVNKSSDPQQRCQRCGQLIKLIVKLKIKDFAKTF